MIINNKIRYLRDIEVLILDNCTRKEAIEYLKNGSIVFDSDDFENNLESYLDEWGYNLNEETKEEKQFFYDMIKNGYCNKCDGWSVVNHGKKRYYIEYVL